MLIALVEAFKPSEALVLLVSIFVRKVISVSSEGSI